MTVSPSTLVETCQLVLRRLTSHFDVDVSYVRRNDHELGATILLAEWPPRTEVPDPDPLGVIFFADSDPVFAALEDLTEVLIVRPDVKTTSYQERVRAASGVLGVSAVTVPMLGRDMTTGVLGLLKYGDREWTPTEITALTAMAALLAQALSRVTAEAQLRYLAYHDELTGLYNRRALLDHLGDRLGPGAQNPVVVLFLDLDRLKAMNDLLGHTAGDQFLQSVAQRLQETAGPTDFLARFGGDELVVVLGSPTEPDAALDTAERIRHVVNAPVSLGDNEVSRTVSVGVAVCRPGDQTVSGLLAQAAQAAIAAKTAGGNQILAFTEQMRVDNDERADVELHLRDAIAHGELRLHYQPQIDLVTGKLIGAEALVRWHHPTRGLLPPASFVEIAELTNLSGELGRWVLDSACAQLAQWQRKYDLTGFCLGVNVSAAQLITVDLAADVAATLQRHSVDARNVTLEITETAVVADIGRARETLLALTDLGVHLAIDDFGTGYSSFAQLKTLPVETLKIDRGFVTNLVQNRDDQAIVRSIIQLATSFGLQTMAEGVETPEVAAALIELDCHQAQGYLIGRPAPALDLAGFLQRERCRPDPVAPADDRPALTSIRGRLADRSAG
ncbi:putative bifunctional diguanylate cyclase/phosphodiesterase [uncultured Jatrophihabitans sp.]|uniref:putative bifunctional diguanylate cyclase/phosphodiesterase n=1 Tax=uncultured Jatrophihabitans sp. TaxID=1610747 RepID=UPI0035CA9EE8